MLVLTLDKREPVKIRMTGGIEIEVLRIIGGNRCKVGITAPPEIKIDRVQPPPDLPPTPTTGE